LARTGAVIKGFDPEKSKEFLESAVKAAEFIKKELCDEKEKILYRVYREGRGDTKGFADDYAFLIEGLIDLYEATFDESWLQWADELQRTYPSIKSPINLPTNGTQNNKSPFSTTTAPLALAAFSLPFHPPSPQTSSSA
jgi:hypothetical protein